MRTYLSTPFPEYERHHRMWRRWVDLHGLAGISNQAFRSSGSILEPPTLIFECDNFAGSRNSKDLVGHRQHQTRHSVSLCAWESDRATWAGHRGLDLSPSVSMRSNPEVVPKLSRAGAFFRSASMG